MADSIPDNIVYLISRPAVLVLEKQNPKWQGGLASLQRYGGPFYQFPDGSVHVENSQALSELQEKWPVDLLGASGLFRGLAPFLASPGARDAFPRMSYALICTADLAEQLGGERYFGVCPRSITPASPGENQLDRLVITVAFWRKPSRDLMDRFATAVRVWQQTVSTHGLFGEGPVRLVSVDVTFQETRAQFAIDASQSGQNTLNWLVLSMLNFAYDVAPLLGLQFDSEEHTDKYWGPVRGKRETVSIPQYATPPGAGTTILKESLPATVPQNCTAHPEIRSDRFRVLVTPWYEWDDLIVTVFFGAPVDAPQKEELRKVIESWATLAFYGALGGSGIHRFENLGFDPEGRTYRLSADMGDTAEDLALGTLVRVLEGFHRSVPIDAIVLGRDSAVLTTVSDET